MNDGEAGVAEMVDAGVALTASDKAQIDIQIATAKRYPRDLQKFHRDALALVASSQEVAETMFYALPRDGKHIEGPSVRFAEALVYCWGNIRVEARVVAVDATHVTSQGTCLDLEKNIGCRVEVKRRITDKRGKRFNDDMIVVTGNAGASIAFRNAVFKVIPFALAKGIYEQARKVAVGGNRPIEARRTAALQWFARAGAPEPRMLQMLGVNKVDEITEDHLLLLTGIKNAIIEGDTTIEAALSGGVEKQTTATSNINDKLFEDGKEGAAQRRDTNTDTAQAGANGTSGAASQPARAPVDEVPEVVELVRYIATLKPTGGNATSDQRDRMVEYAGQIFPEGHAQRVQLHLLAGDGDLGKGQAGKIVGLGVLAIDAIKKLKQPDLV